MADFTRTHGESFYNGRGTREYRTWKAMMTRCNNPHYRRFDRYGGRGIRVCERWNDYAAFLADMGRCPPKHTLERIDNNGDYEPANVRWTTQAEQMRNTSRTRLITRHGITLCLTDWAAKAGLSYAHVHARLKRGWPLERALTTHVRR